MTDEQATGEGRPTRQAINGVVLVTLDRPEVLNALDYRTLGELADALESLDVDESVQVRRHHRGGRSGVRCGR